MCVCVGWACVCTCLHVYLCVCVLRMYWGMFNHYCIYLFVCFAQLSCWHLQVVEFPLSCVSITIHCCPHMYSTRFCIYIVLVKHGVLNLVAWHTTLQKSTLLSVCLLFSWLPFQWPCRRDAPDSPSPLWQSRCFLETLPRRSLAASTVTHTDGISKVHLAARHGSLTQQHIQVVSVKITWLSDTAVQGESVKFTWLSDTVAQTGGISKVHLAVRHSITDRWNQ